VFGGVKTEAFGSAQKSPFRTSSTSTTVAFGACNSGCGGGFGISTTQQTNISQQASTENPPYQSTREIHGRSSSNYISICLMPAYQHKSHEELRNEDYSRCTSIDGPTGTFGSIAAPSTGGSMFGFSKAAEPAEGESSFQGFHGNTQRHEECVKCLQEHNIPIRDDRFIYVSVF
jgi:hypothetical protein